MWHFKHNAHLIQILLVWLTIPIDGSRRIDSSWLIDGCWRNRRFLTVVRRSSRRWWWWWCSLCVGRHRRRCTAGSGVDGVAAVTSSLSAYGRRQHADGDRKVPVRPARRRMASLPDGCGIYLIVVELEGPSWPSRQWFSRTSLLYQSQVATTETSYI